MKKGFLLSAFMAAHTLLTGTPAHADASEDLAQAQVIIQNIEDVSISHLCDRQFILIGDTNHNDPAVQRGIYSQEILQDLANCGISKIFMEIDASGQILIDALKAGVFTPVELARQAYGEDDDPTVYSERDAKRDIILAKDNFILEAHQRGINVIAIDDQKEAHRLKQESLQARSQAIETWSANMTDEMQRAFRQVFLTNSAPKDIKDTVIQALYDLEENDPDIYAAGAKLYEDYIGKEKAVIALRNNDENLHRAITAQVQPDETVAIIFGNDHFKGENSLKWLLGSDFTRHIVIGDIGYKTDADMVINKEIFSPIIPQTAPKHKLDSFDLKN